MIDIKSMYENVENIHTDNGRKTCVFDKNEPIYMK